jgi:26S proteasome regulatory subunit N5
MISYGLHESKYLDLCKYYMQIYDSPSVQADESKWASALRNAVFFVVLAPYDNEQHDLLQRLSANDKLQSVGEC